jgi:hypothetical protein
MNKKRIAAVLCPALLAVTLSEANNLEIWDDVHSSVGYLNGLIFLVGGLVIVTTHSFWQLDFRLLVTVSGCLLLIAGAIRMFFPKVAQLAPNPGT